MSSEAGSGSGHPPKPAPGCSTLDGGTPSPSSTARGRADPAGQQERGRRADLAAFLDDVWPDGHDLVVEDVVLFYLAVDQRQVSPKAFAAQRILGCTGVGVSNGGMGGGCRALGNSSWRWPWSWAWVGSGVCSVWMPQEHGGEIGCAGGQPWENQFGGFNPSLAGRV